MCFCTMIHKLVWCILKLIGKIYTNTIAMQMNVLEIIQIEGSGFWLRKREAGMKVKKKERELILDSVNVYWVCERECERNRV